MRISTKTQYLPVIIECESGEESVDLANALRYALSCVPKTQIDSMAAQPLMSIVRRLESMGL